MHFDIRYSDEPVTLQGQHEPVAESKRYVVSNIPDIFWFDENVLNDLRRTIDQLEQIEHNQNAIHIKYLEFCKLVTNEMDRKLLSKIVKIYVGIKMSTRKRKKEYQPWWCTELGDLWVEMCEAENNWLSCQHGPRRSLLKSVQKRKRFDKNKTKQKRIFWKSEQDWPINEAETDPNKFWKSIGKIGIKQDRKPVILMEVYDSHGSITGYVDKVLSKWKDDFTSLFKDKAGFDDEFLASVKVKVKEYESEMNDIINDENVDVKIHKA